MMTPVLFNQSRVDMMAWRARASCIIAALFSSQRVRIVNARLSLLLASPAFRLLFGTSAFCGTTFLTSPKFPFGDSSSLENLVNSCRAGVGSQRRVARSITWARNSNAYTIVTAVQLLTAFYLCQLLAGMTGWLKAMRRQEQWACWQMVRPHLPFGTCKRGILQHCQ